MLKFVKLENGMTGECVVVLTDAPQEEIVAQLKARMERETLGLDIYDEWWLIREHGFFIKIIGGSDDSFMDEFDSNKIDAVYYLEDYMPEENTTKDSKLLGLMFQYSDESFGYWRNFHLSRADEIAIRNILSKYETDGDIICGTMVQIFEDLQDSPQN